MNPFDFLSQHPLFGKADAASLASLAKDCTQQAYAKGKIVVERDSAHNHVLVLEKGALALHRSNRETGAQIFMGLIEAPGVLGDAELYAKTLIWMVTAKATERGSLLAIPNEVFQQFVQDHPSIAVDLYADACARLMNATEIAQIFGLQRTQHKILRLLWTLSYVVDGHRRAPLSIVQLSRALALNEKTVWRNLRDLEASQMIKQEGRQALLFVDEKAAFGGNLMARGLGSSWRLRS